jgi:beta-lactamase superfamily II metal-dependent hydrolase
MRPATALAVGATIELVAAVVPEAREVVTHRLTALISGAELVVLKAALVEIALAEVTLRVVRLVVLAHAVPTRVATRIVVVALVASGSVALTVLLALRAAVCRASTALMTTSHMALRFREEFVGRGSLQCVGRSLLREFRRGTVQRSHTGHAALLPDAATGRHKIAPMRLVVVLGVTVLGCSGAPPSDSGTAANVRSVEAPERPSFELHVVDVGTGLGVFVSGPDFGLVYDAGSNDDTVIGKNNRFTSYLRATEPDRQSLEHVLLSHPHRDHVELLADVVLEYQVDNVWEPGLVNPICGYRRFLEALSQRPQTAYHTAAFDAGTHTIDFEKEVCKLAPTVTVAHAARAEENVPIELGWKASMRLLHVDGERHSDFNQSSLVALLELDGTRVLLMGDAEAGSNDLAKPPTPRSIEGRLLARHRQLIDADVLVVGHHGSTTSSHAAFLEAVTPEISIISSGPVKYHSVRLPEREVVEALASSSRVFQTTVGDDDAACLTNDAKIGPDADNNPGGCDNVVVEMRAGELTARYARQAD